MPMRAVVVPRHTDANSSEKPLGIQGDSPGRGMARPPQAETASPPTR